MSLLGSGDGPEPTEFALKKQLHLIGRRLPAKARRRAHVELLSRRAGAAGFAHRDLGRLILMAATCRQHLAEADHLRARESFFALIEKARHAALWFGECGEES